MLTMKKLHTATWRSTAASETSLSNIPHGTLPWQHSQEVLPEIPEKDARQEVVNAIACTEAKERLTAGGPPALKAES